MPKYTSGGERWTSCYRTIGCFPSTAQFKVTEINPIAVTGTTHAPAAKSISRKQPIISLSNSVLVLDYKRTRVPPEESNRQDIYQEGDIIVITNNSNALLAGKRLIVGPSPKVNITFNRTYDFKKGPGYINRIMERASLQTT